MAAQPIRSKARTGVPGLDDILAGGLARGRVFLLEGSPGTGKTTIALRFLMEGAKHGEQGLYVTLSETANELRTAAASHGWTLGDEIEVFEVVPPESLLDADQQQSLLYSSDLELGETTQADLRGGRAHQGQARRARFACRRSACSAQSSLRYRRQILALKHYFARHGSTVLMLDDLTADTHRQDRAQRRPRRDPAGGDGARLRRRAPPAAGHQVSRARPSAAATTTSSSGPAACRSFRAWSPPSTPAIRRASRIGPAASRPGHAAGRRHRAAARARCCSGPAGAGKWLITPAVRRARRSRAAARRRCSSSTRSSACCSTAPSRWASTSRRCATRASSLITQLDAAELSPGEFAHRVRDARRGPGGPDRRDRQPERLPGGDAARRTR